MGRSVQEFKIATKYYGNFCLSKVENSLILLSTNMSTVFKRRFCVPINLNDFRVAVFRYIKLTASFKVRPL